MSARLLFGLYRTIVLATQPKLKPPKPIEKAKEDKAKAIAAAEAKRKAKLAAVEWMNQDSGSVASEAWF